MDNFEEIKELILHYVRGIWRNRWIAIAVAWPLLIGGVLIVDQLKDRYSASTKVYIDTSTLLRPLLSGLAIQTDIRSDVNLMARQLKARPNIERVIRLMDMDLHTSSERDLEQLINKVRDRLQVNSSRRSNTYTISYSDENPQTAKRMVQTLLDIFVEDTLGKSVNESDTALSFIDKQIQKYDRLLQEAEERLEEFKRKNVGLMPKDGASYYSKLQSVSERLKQSELELMELTNRRNELKSQIESIDVQGIPAKLSSEYDGQIRRQELKLDDLLLLYTDEHPDVQNTRRVLEALQKRREADLAELEKRVTSTKLDNPVLQQLQISFTENEANISALKARVSSYALEKKRFAELVNVIPKIEAELKRLNRDYGVHKQNYQELVKRREKALISEDVESGTEQVKFRVIEPPHVPSKPSYPNRLVYDLAVLVFSLGAGYGLGLLISLAQPVLYNANDVKKISDLPVLGVVPKFDTPDVLSIRRRNLILFITANISLVILALAFIGLHMKGILIVSQLQQFAGI